MDDAALESSAAGSRDVGRPWIVGLHGDSCHADGDSRCAGADRPGGVGSAEAAKTV